ncbi:hypothetical protein BJ138DRAFT_964713, partial [Hygrophoropsis aurantiaca]
PVAIDKDKRRSIIKEWHCLQAGKQPRNALANFQYYAHCRVPPNVKAAMDKASAFDKMLVSRCRASKVTHLYLHKLTSPGRGQPEHLSQSYNRGNVAVVPQDSITLRTLLPPAYDEIRDTMCALFIGGRDKPTAETLKRIGPVLVTKSIVEKLICFFCERNPYYRDAQVSYSQAHLDDLFDEHERDRDVAVPRGVEIAHLAETDALNAGTAGYTDR